MRYALGMNDVCIPCNRTLAQRFAAREMFAHANAQARERGEIPLSRPCPECGVDRGTERKLVRTETGHLVIGEG